jgi:hypothetical protein
MSFGAQLAGNLLASKYFGNAFLKMTKPYSGFGRHPGFVLFPQPLDIAVEGS